MDLSQVGRRSYADIYFDEYVNKLLTYIKNTPKYNMQGFELDVIAKYWQNSIPYNEENFTDLMTHARNFMDRIKSRVVFRTNFLESLTDKMAVYLTPYAMRARGVNSQSQANTILKRELFDRNSLVRYVKKIHRIRVQGDEIARAKRQKLAAQNAQSAAQKMRHRCTVYNGKKYERVI